ncbi:bifunctional SulP family inorganic anion transporter/carbonic anhydrase [Luteitalea sp.]|uniref:bifunctional SulP family inorganic anion transporter/carbonic anhydrase n=1 Tax=Luteitalea sp. TaxID=2004800 RepID=UPI0025C374FE|nr:bifunctional SulP family inorganic anion transporter/carbonic anhydrase [Luteitalea sp.]
MPNPTVPPAFPQAARPGLFSAPRQDVLASLVVFLIAIPLSLGIALASGAPIMAGLIAGIVGGIVTGLIAGAPLQVTGPAAGLTAIVFGLVEQFGDWRLVAAAVVIGGLIQIVLGLSRIARLCLAVSPAVVHGMLAGIGITIALAQLHIILGGAPESQALKNLLALPAQLGDLHAPAAFLGLATIALLLAWQWVPRPLSAVPASLVAVMTATGASVLLGLDVERINLQGGFGAGFQFAVWPGADLLVAVLVGGITIAAVASVESLLCAVATDKLHTGPRANLDRELVGQGLANTVSGLLGGLPVTGVIVRSSANIQAGGQTQLSAILHSIWILLFVLFLGWGIELIPLCVLAGLLVHVGIRLVNAHHIRRLLTFGEALVYFVTVGGVIVLGLLPGIGLGLALAVLLLLRRLSYTNVQVEGTEGKYHVRIGGSMTFVGIPQLSAALQAIPPGTQVDVDLMVDFMDHAAFEALHDWRVSHERLGGTVDIDELHEAWYANAAKGTPHFAKSRIDGLLGALRRRSRAKTSMATTALTTEPLLQGAAAFNATTSRDVKPLLSHLADVGQTPQALFITCADSRIVPADLVNADPGDIFVLRNIGNIVPAWTGDPGADDSVGSAIEFAVDVLNVHSIVVCGHSECGAMKALLGDHDALGGSLGRWLAHGTSALRRHEAAPAHPQSTSPHNSLARTNVVEQVERLQTYPSVQRAVADGSLRLYGWFFDLKRAKVTVWDHAAGQFVDAGAEAQTLEPPVRRPA